MSYRVFSQTPGLDVALLAERARRYFHLELDALEHGDPSATGDGHALVRLTLPPGAYRSGPAVRQFRITTRKTAEHDRRDARLAEAQGQAAGLGLLAERCAHIWCVEAVDQGTAQDTLALCAVLSTVALGPVLPADCSTLLGMRSAAERCGLR